MTKVGQIIPNQFVVSRYITSLASRSDVHNIVEIGTWNGMGSTRCVLEGLESKSDYIFQSYECFIEMYNEAIENNRGKLGEKFKIICGKIVDEGEITDWFDVDGLNQEQKGWLQQDIDRMSNVKNVLDTVPSVIDLLILDGGEFSTYKEWLMLRERTRYFVLDDTTCLKSKRIREEVLSSPLHVVISDNLNERNGYLVGRTI